MTNWNLKHNGCRQRVHCVASNRTDFECVKHLRPTHKALTSVQAKASDQGYQIKRPYMISLELLINTTTTPTKTPKAISKAFPESQLTAALALVVVAVVLVEDVGVSTVVAEMLLDGGIVFMIVAIDVLAVVLLAAVVTDDDDITASDDVEKACEDLALEDAIDCEEEVSCDEAFAFEDGLGCGEASVTAEVAVMVLITPPTGPGGISAEASGVEVSALSAYATRSAAALNTCD